MTPIKRHYWNNNIPECKQIPHSAWIKTHIEGHDYYGRSLKGKHFEKCKIVVGKIIPLFILSIALAPISIPVLFAMDKFRELGISIREVHYNTKINCIVNTSNTPLSKSKVTVQPAPEVIDRFPITADAKLIPLLFINPSIADSKAGVDYLRLLSCVSKSFTSTIQETKKALINSKKLHLKDIPGITTKDDALNHIPSGGDLTHLDFTDLSPEVCDADISTIVAKWPNLKSLSLTVGNLSNFSKDAIDELSKLTQLKDLTFSGDIGNNRLDPSSLSTIETLSIHSTSLPSPLDISKPMIHLKKLTHIANSEAFPSFENFSSLKELKISLSRTVNHPNLDCLVNLEKLIINADYSYGNLLEYLPLDYFDGLINLKTLQFVGLNSILTIPDFPKLKSVENLIINYPNLKKQPSIDLTHLNNVIINNQKVK